ncbi:MAG TPA: sensor histidine kinase, partial [Nocardioides sp.]|nr:sensor histidine kinase [Nocardioides sp.]
MLVLQVVVVLLLGAAATTLAAYDARHDARADATHEVTGVATTFAASPDLVAAVQDRRPSRVVQPLAEAVRHASGVDFVTVMSMSRIRYSHPNPAEIGKRFIGDVGDAPQGHVFTEEYAGTLGPSVRAVAPIRDRQGRVVAMVAVGITVSAIDRRVAHTLAVILAAAAAVLLLGLLGTWLVSRRVRRQTHGLGAQELGRMYEFYSAVLGAMREGLVLLDDGGRVQLTNDEACRLLDLPEDVVGRRFDDLGLAPGLVSTVLGTTASSDHLYAAGERLVLVSSSPATWEGHEVGAIVTLRDQTELRAATGELELVRGLTDSLHALNHEAANRLHTVVSLIELGRPADALDFATAELALSQSLTERLVAAAGDPALTALLVGKSAEAAERGIELTIEGELPELEGIAGRDLVTVVGNLVDNAFEAVASSSQRRVRVRFSAAFEAGDGAVIEVDDSGPGLSPEQAEHALTRGWSTKAEAGHGLGLALVAGVARSHGGAVTIERGDLGG